MNQSAREFNNTIDLTYRAAPESRFFATVQPASGFQIQAPPGLSHYESGSWVYKGTMQQTTCLSPGTATCYQFPMANPPAGDYRAHIQFNGPVPAEDTHTI